MSNLAKHEWRCCGLLVALTAAFWTDSASAEVRSLVSYLNGRQAGLEIVTPAQGFASLVVDTAANTLQYRITFGDLVGIEAIAHIHGPALPGVIGAVQHFLPLGNPKFGTWNYPESREADILEGRMYIVIHSSVYPVANGEIRGQIVDLIAVLNGSQQVPPNRASGRGLGLFSIDLCANELSYYMLIESLDGQESAADIRGFGLHDVESPVVHSLPAGELKVGSWNYADADEDAILAGRCYVDIYSLAYPDGEIRGQIVRTVAPMDVAQVPPGGGVSLRYGGALCAYDASADSLSYYMVYGGLTDAVTGAHLHGFAAAGVGGAPVLQDLGTANPIVGVWSYPASSEAEVFDGLAYVDVHSTDWPDGAIRGQLVFPVARCAADLSCDGLVNATDLAALLGAWGANPSHPADLTGDGMVNAADLAVLLGAWGMCG